MATPQARDSTDEAAKEAGLASMLAMLASDVCAFDLPAHSLMHPTSECAFQGSGFESECCE